MFLTELLLERIRAYDEGARNGPAGRPVYNLTMYSAQLLDHFQNPRNAGDIADADASAEIENPVCGDVIRLSLKLQNGRIARVGFKAKGCVPAMACGSALTELACGKTVLEARRLRREDLLAAVGGLPQASTHAAQLALDALSAALQHIEPPENSSSHGTLST